MGEFQRWSHISTKGGLYGRTRGWGAERTGRAPMHSPGRPGINRGKPSRVRRHIAAGLLSEDAAMASGVSQPVDLDGSAKPEGPPISLVHLRVDTIFAEREELALLHAQGCVYGDCPTDGSVAIDCVSRAAAQCGHPLRHGCIPSHGCAVEGRARGGASKIVKLASIRNCKRTFKIDYPVMS